MATPSWLDCSVDLTALGLIARWTSLLPCLLPCLLQMSAELQQRKANVADLFSRFAGDGTSQGASRGSSSGGGPREDDTPGWMAMDLDLTGGSASLPGDIPGDLPGDQTNITSKANGRLMTVAGLQRLCAALRLGFSPADVAVVCQAADSTGSNSLTPESFASLFRLPLEPPSSAGQGQGGEEEEGPRTWMCSNCGHTNHAYDMMCDHCGFGWTGKREVPPDKWECDGCSFFNPKAQFYCDMCNRARPDLSTIRF